MSELALGGLPCKGSVLRHGAYDLVIVSPHLDDAVFSCGGLIGLSRASGERVLVLTCFTADPPLVLSPLAHRLHALWGGADVNPYIARRDEDRRAMQLLDADYLWLDCPELIYRDPAISAWQQAADPAADPRQDPLFEDLCGWLAAFDRAVGAPRFVVPLGVGGHRDHRLAAAAARAVVDPARCYAYADFPYCAWNKGEAAQRAAEQQLAADELDVTRTIARRVTAAQLYASQIAGLFENVRGLQRALLTDAMAPGRRDRFVERYWRPVVAPPLSG